MKALEPTIIHGDAEWLSQVILRSKDSGQVLRLQGVRFRMLGYSVAETTHLLGVSPQALREWIHLWNDGGVDALATQPKAGRPRKGDYEVYKLVKKWIHGRLSDGTPYTALAIHGQLKKKDPI